MGHNYPTSQSQDRARSNIGGRVVSPNTLNSAIRNNPPALFPNVGIQTPGVLTQPQETDKPHQARPPPPNSFDAYKRRDRYEQFYTPFFYENGNENVNMVYYIVLQRN